MAVSSKLAPELRKLGELTDEQLNAIDVAVGGQVRTRRILLGMSQEAVSKSLGLTFQQLQKYEHGSNRISASRLAHLAIILHTSVSFFFETVDVGSDEPHVALETDQVIDAADAIPKDLMRKRKTVELVRTFYAIDDKQRAAALNLLKTMKRSST